MYWGQEQEEAIIAFNGTEDVDEKHKIYVAVIQPAFKKLTENIYNTFNFGKILRDFDQVQHDMIIHLYEKLEKFDHTRGTKSFSYFGTVAKNWCIQQSNKAKKNVYIDNDNHEVIMHSISYKQHVRDSASKEQEDFVRVLTEYLSEIEKYVLDLTDDDKAIIEIINEILKEYKRLDIYNKKQLYLYVREATGLPARKITKTINKVRVIYTEVKNEYLN